MFCLERLGGISWGVSVDCIWFLVYVLTFVKRLLFGGHRQISRRLVEE